MGVQVSVQSSCWSMAKIQLEHVEHMNTLFITPTALRYLRAHVPTQTIEWRQV